MLGIESQEHIHYAMPMRVMGYDYGTYKKQYDSNAKKYQKKDGIMKGKTEGIQALIESLQEMEIPYTKTQNQLMVKFSLSEDTAQEYMDKFWK